MFLHQLHLRCASLRLLALLLGLLIAGTTLATPAYADLPPRPTRPPQEKEDEPIRPLVAPLILSTNPNQSGLWSIVQWQDAQGGWQDVSGWRGTVVKGRTIWWVEQKDFGKGPYRWVVLQGEGGAVIATSQPFNLPGQPQKPLVIEVALP